MFFKVRWVGIALALTVAACNELEESPTEAETESAVMTPNVGGLYGSELYACTNQVGSYCYSPMYGSPIASTPSAVQPFLDSAARNWGCDWNFSFNAPAQRPSGAWTKWYGTQADNTAGCGVAWWNPKKQAAYFIPNGASTAIQGSDHNGNVALATRGATVSVSSTYSTATPASAIIDGNRRGNPWGNGGGWSSRYAAGYPTAASPLTPDASPRDT